MDIAINWDAAHFRGDWGLTTGDLQIAASDLESAVLVSLFTDRVASPDFVPPAGSPPDRRGWWADTYRIAAGQDAIGSSLWQLNRAVKSNSAVLLAQAQGYCQQALQWLVTQGIVASVNVETSWLTPETMAIGINITKPQSPPQTFNYSWAWGNAGQQ
jgi:phage gp46-like protein